MLKGIENNTSIKDFITIMDKQIVKLKNTDPPQEPKGTLTKATTSKDTTENNKVNTPKTIPMQPHDKNSKTNDLIENTKVKITTQHNNNNTESDDKHKGVTAKRNASARSPLKGNPGKGKRTPKRAEKWKSHQT